MNSFDSGMKSRVEDQEDCHYIGHLANEPDKCVAMTGCFGYEDVEVTILSEHASKSGMYRWKMDGSMENIESPWKVHLLIMIT